MTTEQGNILIAKFMGAEKSRVDGDIRYLRFPEPHAGTKTFAFYPHELHYHYSWDWLMPVVEKINKIDGYDVIIYKTTVHVNDEREILFETTGKIIDAVWEATVKFIQHYNSRAKSSRP